MNHARQVLYEGQRAYRVRSHCTHLLDERTQDMLQHDQGSNGYCLDALEDLPAGSMASTAFYVYATMCMREDESIDFP